MERVSGTVVAKETEIAQPSLPAVEGYGGTVDSDAPAAVAVSASTAGPPTPPRRSPPRYVGGFSTSICSLFRDPGRHTDCCAIACCGVLLSDRTRYLLTKRRPPSWWKRLAINLLVPVAILFGMNVVDAEVEDEDLKGLLHFMLLLLLLSYVIVVLVRARFIRARFRDLLVRRLYTAQAEAAGALADDAEVDNFMLAQKYHNNRAHMMCCNYSFDRIYTVDDVPTDDEDDRGDLCSCLWRFVSDLCCGWCCGCWLQCCGMCAIGQESREVDGMVRASDLMIDYVTFQPWREYFPAINSLRLGRDGGVTAHWKALSRLSVELCKVLVGVLLALFLFALMDINSNFTVENMLVLLATFVQAFLVLYFVHWQWHRFDLSIDAVIKYFACGFLLSTFLAMLFEQIISIFVEALLSFMETSAIISDVIQGNLDQEDVDQEEAMKEFVRTHPGIYIFYFFLNSFCVAALIEELCKYFGFWMMEHPDFIPAQEIIPDDDRRDEAESEGIASEHVISSQRRSMNSVGVGVTIAMVSVSLGFACCENLGYVFLVSSSSVGAKFSTLLVRSMFPIHPLAAAIQSIGVCKRDLEGDKTSQLGTIILPAVFLHGFYDFVLMTMAFLDAINQEGGGDGGSNGTEDGGQDDDSIDWVARLPSLAVGMAFVVAGVIYYAFLSTAQKARLSALDNAHRAVSPVDSQSLIV